MKDRQAYVRRSLSTEELDVYYHSVQKVAEDMRRQDAQAVPEATPTRKEPGVSSYMSPLKGISKKSRRPSAGGGREEEGREGGAHDRPCPAFRCAFESTSQ